MVAQPKHSGTLLTNMCSYNDNYMNAHNYALGFSTLNKELAPQSVRVQGALPPWLEGTLVRTGPARFEVEQQSLRHWFDGFAMLHAFSFRGGKATYANKFLQSKAYSYAQQHGKIGYREFASDPCRSIFKRFVHMFCRPQNGTDNGNVNIAKIADKFVALTEIPLPVAFDLKTLRATGIVEYDIQGDYTTAHPHYCAQETLNFVTHFAKNSTYNVYRMSRTRRTLIGSIPAKKPAYIHSFGLTQNYVIIIEYPFTVTPLCLLATGKPFIENFRWRAQQKTRIMLMHRTTGAFAHYTAEPFFAFHHINAFEQGENVIIDLCAYEDAAIIQALYLDRLRGTNGDAAPIGQFRRYTISRASASCEVVSDDLAELPRINYEAANAKPYRFAYGLGRHNPHSFLDKIVKVDIPARSSAVWCEAACYPGEPVFVPGPHAKHEDEGVILSVVLNAKKGVSFLLVLDARTFAEIARCEVPHHIPFGFHGNFYFE